VSDSLVLAAILDSPWERAQEAEIEIVISLDALDVEEAFCTIIDAPTERVCLDDRILAMLQERP
jgi:hypothetical protein